MRKLILALFFGINFLGFAAMADALSDKARTRQYDGGMDEQPLTVQQILAEPRTDGSESLMQKKILSATDETPAEHAEPTTDEESHDE